MIKKYKKKDGSQAWKIVAYLGVDPATGRQRRTTRQGFATKREAQAALRALELKGLPDKKKPKITLQQLFDEWFALYQPTVKPSTANTTKITIAYRALNSMGNYYIDKITPSQLQKLMDTKHANQSRRVAAALRRLFRYAIKVGYIKDNPADRITAPKQSRNLQKNKIKYLTLPQISQLFDNIKAYPNENAVIRDTALISLLIYSGLRIGEAFSLNWDDLDGTIITVSKTVSYDGSKAYISDTTKTASGRRKVEINQKTVHFLNLWRERQKMLATAFKKPVPHLMFTSLRTNNFIPVAGSEPILNRYLDNLPKITWHALRHTHASLLFASGASMKDVQDRLGHSNIETTMNVYTHMLPERKTQVATNFFKYMDKNS